MEEEKLLPSYGVMWIAEDDECRWYRIKLYETEAEALLEAASLHANDICHYIKKLIILIRKGENRYADHYEWRPGVRPEWIPEGMEGLFPEER